ncbi:hypothetical protein H9Q72_007100 [Fusarium xylarioides]|uniref:DUF7918 domain-containing protein n=1 Tax=Fusarium xylarioides TaxID=221167 RepID=A0A9P7HWE7_9HYPO|nr:hypothetical protein H9Q70_006395 [Fusarium xylarioides]KAG5764833.1 hypothetical protein H9Q72_007100 [Fusarium xylarioides]KAG5779506.1 hypothetical protein H9Q73_006849 [Fusarium xylarioides]KAG5814864.1 hypothetical protein H9Q71_003012 [Fusarium xylarioides]KAG5827317.1 hypothetical protein H9Q74_002606 [Fusarium xylarioides]
MAVLPFTPGINVSILVDGIVEGSPLQTATEHIPLPEDFPPLIDATSTDVVDHNRCHIQSHAGKHFAIRLRISPIFKFPFGKNTIIVSIYVDGKPFDNVIVPKRHISSAACCDEEYDIVISSCHREFSDGSSKCYKPVFQDIRHPAYQADDGCGISDLESIMALGSIQVAIEVAREIGPGVMGNDEFTDNKRNQALAIDNDALQDYGSGQIHATTYTRTAEALDLDYVAVDQEKHIGNFFFYYQSAPAPRAGFNLQPRFKDDNADKMVHLRWDPSQASK